MWTLSQAVNPVKKQACKSSAAAAALCHVCGPLPFKGIYPGLLSVGRYPALSCQSPMNAMCWPGSKIFHGKVFFHPAETGVLCLLRQVEGICREGGPNILC